jgi:hypothetical protein
MLFGTHPSFLNLNSAIAHGYVFRDRLKVHTCLGCAFGEVEFADSVAADEIAANWLGLHSFCAQSPLALSLPVLGSNRALQPLHDLGRQPFFRAQRSVGTRYLLKTDIARFYPSITRIAFLGPSTARH